MPFDSMKRCKACALREGATQVVVGHGHDDAKYMIVGEAPGADEDAEGMPFVGRSGNLLFSTIYNHGIYRYQFYVTNVVKCRPPENQDPPNFAVEACKRLLNIQIKKISPKIIITVGRFALHHFDASLKISGVHGMLLERGRYSLYPIFHPAYIMRNSRLMPIFNDDIRRLCEIIKKDKAEKPKFKLESRR